MWCKIENPKLRQFILDLAKENGVCPNYDYFRPHHTILIFLHTVEGNSQSWPEYGDEVTIEQFVDAIITNKQITLDSGKVVEIGDTFEVGGNSVPYDTIKEVLRRYHNPIMIGPYKVYINSDVGRESSCISCGCVTLTKQDVDKLEEALKDAGKL